MERSSYEKMNLALIEREFDAGRYNIISSTGELPAILQGPRGGTCVPGWASDFTHNGNVPSAIAASRELGRNEDKIPLWEEMLEKMPEYMIDDNGIIKEWLTPRLTNRDRHQSRGRGTRLPLPQASGEPILAEQSGLDAQPPLVIQHGHQRWYAGRDHQDARRIESRRGQTAAGSTVRLARWDDRRRPVPRPNRDTKPPVVSRQGLGEAPGVQETDGHCGYSCGHNPLRRERRRCQCRKGQYQEMP